MKRVALHFAFLSCLFLCAVPKVAAVQDQHPTSASPAAPFAGATISDWKGNVRLSLPGQTFSVPVRGEALPGGTSLETGNGRLLLLLSDGSQVLIAPHTSLQVQRPTQGDQSYFQLLLGRIRAFIKKQTGGAPAFQLGTPSAVIAVRGTQFDVEVNLRRVTEVDVMEGLVEVSGRGVPGASVLVEPGFSTRVGMDTPPEAPEPTDEMRPDMERSGREMDFEESREHGRREGARESQLASERTEMMELPEVSEEAEVDKEEGPGHN